MSRYNERRYKHLRPIRLEEDVTPLIPLDADENVPPPYPKGLDTDEPVTYGGADATGRTDSAPAGEAPRAPRT